MRSKVIDERRQPDYFPYYKLQWYKTHVAAWMDVQRRFKTPGLALEHGREHLRGFGIRVMVITRQGREIYQD